MNRRRTLLDWLRTGVWFGTSTLTFAVLMCPCATWCSAWRCRRRNVAIRSPSTPGVSTGST